MTNVDPAKSAPCFKCSYNVCIEYSDTVNPSTEVAINCTYPSEKFRYVVIQGSHDAPICLTEVAVYERSKQQLCLIDHTLAR